MIMQRSYRSKKIAQLPLKYRKVPSLILVTGAEFYAGQLISFSQPRDWLENTKKQLKKCFPVADSGEGLPLILDQTEARRVDHPLPP